MSERLDLSSDPPSGPSNSGGASRKFIGIRFACCDAYARVYVNSAGTAYEGRCPRCMRTIAVKIGPGGTDQRFFVAG